MRTVINIPHNAEDHRLPECRYCENFVLDLSTNHDSDFDENGMCYNVHLHVSCTHLATCNAHNEAMRQMRLEKYGEDYRDIENEARKEKLSFLGHADQ